MPPARARVKSRGDFFSMRQNYNGLLAPICSSRRARKASLIQGFAGKGAAPERAEGAARRLRVYEGKNPSATGSLARCNAGGELSQFFSGLPFHIYDMFDRGATISSQTRRFCYTPCCPHMRGVRYSLNGSNDLLAIGI